MINYSINHIMIAITDQPLTTAKKKPTYNLKKKNQKQLSTADDSLIATTTTTTSSRENLLQVVERGSGVLLLGSFISRCWWSARANRDSICLSAFLSKPRAFGRNARTRNAGPTGGGGERPARNLGVRHTPSPAT